MADVGSALALDIRVGNVRNERDGRYIGRAVYKRKGSPLGNTFRIGPDGTRKKVIQKYDTWLRGRIRARDLDVLRELAELLHAARRGPLVLLCWCAPEACHGHVVAKVLQQLHEFGVDVLERDGSIFGLLFPARRVS